MSVSAFVRFLIAIFEWLETVGLPALRLAVHWVRTRCAFLREKLDFRPILDYVRLRWFMVPAQLRRILCRLGDFAIDTGIIVGSGALVACIWYWAWLA